MGNKIKKIFLDKNLYIYGLITIVFFGILSKLEFATDSYVVFMQPTKQYMLWFLKSGRLISACFLGVCRLLNLGTPFRMYTVSFVIAIISTIAAMYLLHNMIKEDIKNKFMGFIIPVLIVINIFSIELYLFMEKGIMMFSVLLEILAVYFFKKALEKNKKFLLLSILMMLLANFSYQGTVGLFVVISAIYVIKYSKNIKEFLLNNVLLGIVYVVPALVNYGIVKIFFHNARVSGGINIVKSISRILELSKSMMIETYGMLPKYMFIGIFVVLICLIVIAAIINKKKIIVVSMFYVIVITYLAAVAPQIMQSTDAIGFAARNTYPFAAIIAALLLLIYLSDININKYIQCCFVIIISILLIFQYRSFTAFERDRYIVNYMDNQFARIIREKLNKYESENKIEVKRVGFVTKGTGASYSYPDIRISGDMNLKANFPEWAREYFIQYAIGRKFEMINIDKSEYSKYFADDSDNYFKDSHVIFDKDVMYIYIY